LYPSKAILQSHQKVLSLLGQLSLSVGYGQNCDEVSALNKT